MSFITKNFQSLFKLGIAYIRNEHYPFICVLRLADNCNLNCSYCDSSSFNQSISFQRLLPFLNQVYKRGCRLVTLTGGEPFLYHSLDELCQWLLSKNIYVTINTNGQLIDNPKYKDFLRTADEVLVSFDGIKNLHEMQRGHDTYSKVLHTLEFLKEHNIITTLSVVLHNKNTSLENLEEIERVGKKYNAKIGINLITNRGRINNSSNFDTLQLSDENNLLLSKFFSEKQKSFPLISQALLKYWRNPTPINCKTYQFAHYVDVDHFIYPCINSTDRMEARVCSIDNYPDDFKSKNIHCDQCSCLPLIQGNILLQKSIPPLKSIATILKRYIG